MGNKINKFIFVSILVSFLSGIANAEDIKNTNIEQNQSQFLLDYNKKKEEFEKKKELARKNAAIARERKRQEEVQDISKLNKLDMMNAELKKRGLLYNPK